MKHPFSRFLKFGEKEEQQLEMETPSNNNEEIRKISISDIVPNRFQPRTVFNDRSEERRVGKECPV